LGERACLSARGWASVFDRHVFSWLLQYRCGFVDSPSHPFIDIRVRGSDGLIEPGNAFADVGEIGLSLAEITKMTIDEFISQKMGITPRKRLQEVYRLPESGLINHASHSPNAVDDLHNSG
jgi:hypothetical protein